GLTESGRSAVNVLSFLCLDAYQSVQLPQPNLGVRTNALIDTPPIIKERKGEHTKTLENLASQGYIRARIDGEVCDLSDPPKLEL
ncbi:hypothetical protein ONQ97_27110, partial [Salmonella enterica subsp. enterica serovar Virginia]|nr:hypothetical protein [Salmonella enterica subsp. enterica serovar Virginia]